MSDCVFNHRNIVIWSSVLKGTTIITPNSEGYFCLQDATNIKSISHNHAHKKPFKGLYGSKAVNLTKLVCQLCNKLQFEDSPLLERK